jgi:hypothetical protein
VIRNQTNQQIASVDEGGNCCNFCSPFGHLYIYKEECSFFMYFRPCKSQYNQTLYGLIFHPGEGQDGVAMNSKELGNMPPSVFKNFWEILSGFWSVISCFYLFTPPLGEELLFDRELLPPRYLVTPLLEH